jgi:hypothetical protein
MAEIGNVDIDASASGGAFRINETPSQQSWNRDWKEIAEMELSDDWRVTLQKDTNYIIAQSDQEYSSEEVFHKAADAATRALDRFSVSTDYHGHIKDAYEDRFLWFRDEEDNRHFRKYGTAVVNSEFQASAKIDGEYPEPTIPEWDESFRYFRLSMVTQDLFDAYRNQFLAVEHILSDICPHKPDEGENEWMLRALREAHSRYDLSDFAPDEDNPAKSIHGFQYEHVRCGMFHSKSGSHRLQPRNDSDYKTVQKALRNLTKIYSRIVKEKYEASPGSWGGLTYWGFEFVMQWMKEGNAEIIIMDKRRDTDSEEELDIPTSADVLDAEFSDANSGQGDMSVEYSCDVSEISNKKIRRVELINNTDKETILFAYSNLEDVIDISGFDVFECVEGFQLSTNYRQNLV